MRYDAAENLIRLPVREFCLLALYGGDLDLRPGRGGLSAQRAAAGNEQNGSVTHGDPSLTELLVVSE